MTTGGIYRDIASSEGQPPRSVREGRAYVAIIGIDRYRTWNRPYNAVSDAKGALRLFADLGFGLVAPALFDESATGDALRRLVIDDLSGLGEDDSLVRFFAGHEHTVARTYGGASVRDGYLIPADGDRPGGRAATWIRLESWLAEIARIPCATPPTKIAMSLRRSPRVASPRVPRRYGCTCAPTIACTAPHPPQAYTLCRGQLASPSWGSSKVCDGVTKAHSTR